MKRICRICLNEIADYQYGLLNNEYMSFLIPEMTLTKVEEPITCASCLVALNAAYNFKQMCLTNERRIQNYQRLYVKSEVIDLRQMVLCNANNLDEKDNVSVNTNYEANVPNEFNRNYEKDLANADALDVLANSENPVTNENPVINENPTVSENRLETGIVRLNEAVDIELITVNKDKQSAKETTTTNDKNETRDSTSSIEENLAQMFAESDTEDAVVTMPDQKVQKEELAGTSTVAPVQSYYNSIKRDKRISKCGLFYKCNECDYKCNQSGTMLRHVAIHDPEKKFKCQFCEYKSYRKQSVKVHTLTKHSGKFLKCPECEYQSALRYRMKCHMRVHTKNKPFRCNDCDYAAAYKQTLKAHILQHHNKEKPHKKHMRKNNRNAPYKCDLCDYTAMSKYSVTKHKHSLHNKENFKCTKCSFTSETKQLLTFHILKVHCGMRRKSFNK